MSSARLLVGDVIDRMAELPDATETRAVAQCTACRREWGVELHLFPLADLLPKPRPRPLELPTEEAA